MILPLGAYMRFQIDNISWIYQKLPEMCCNIRDSKIGKIIHLSINVVIGNIYPGIVLKQAVLTVLPCLCLGGLLVALLRLKIEFQKKKEEKK